MQAVSKLLLFLELFLKVLVAIPQGNVLEAELVNLLVFQVLILFPLVDLRVGELLTCSNKNCVFSHRVLECFELCLDFMAFCLFFVQFSLQLTSHLVVPVLSLLEVEPDLMNVCQRIEVLMLIQHLLVTLIKVSLIVLHEENRLLQVIVLSFELMVLFHFFPNCHYQLLLHFWR